MEGETLAEVSDDGRTEGGEKPLCCRAGLECYGKIPSVEQPGVSKLQERSRIRVREIRQTREIEAQ